jgi:hypothetical protein
MKVTINHKNWQWIKDCTSFDDGIRIRLGLIGRTYVSVNGQTTWIF